MSMPPVILFYTPFFGSAPEVADLNPQDRAAFSWERSLFTVADAVVFHVPDLFNYASLKHIAKLEKPTGQIWVAWSMESAVNYPLLSTSSFMGRFDLEMSYRRTADIWIPYYPSRADWLEALSRPLPMKTEVSPIVMFQSAMANKSGRYEYASKLMSKIPIDSYGRVLTNRLLGKPDDGRRTKLATIARYKFCLCLENALEIDYVTEKFFDPMLAGVVPVYRGAPNIDQFAPGAHAFINANEFSSPTELAGYLNELDHNSETYGQFFEWRKRPFFESFEADQEVRCVSPFKKLLEIVKRRRLR
jgi:alpha-1,3-fucosyltransferase 10